MRHERYRRTQRPTRMDEQGGVPDPAAEEFGERRGRYGNFSVYMTVLLILATIAAIVGTIVFWPD